MTFKDRVIQTVKSIPKGKVLSYGNVATLAGSPRAARQVGGILARIGGEERSVPWWRVVNSQGYLSIRGKMYDAKELQKSLLIEDGVEVLEDYTLDNLYFWKPLRSLNQT